MWQLQNKLFEFWFDQWVYYNLLSYYSPIMLYGDYDEVIKTIMTGQKSDSCKSEQN